MTDPAANSQMNLCSLIDLLHIWLYCFAEAIQHAEKVYRKVL